MSTALYEHGLALREVVGDISTLAVSDLTMMFDELGGAGEFEQIMQRAFPGLVQPYLTASGNITAAWYDTLPGADTGFRASAVITLPEARMLKSLGWALGAAGEATPLERLAGSTKRMVADVSRLTVVENAEVERVAFARVTAPGACEFCAMLATRGAVYESRETALAGHDHCRCMAVPVRDVDTFQVPRYVEAYQDEYDTAQADLRDENGYTGDLKQVLAKMRENRNPTPNGRPRERKAPAEMVEVVFGDGTKRMLPADSPAALAYARAKARGVA